MFRRIVVPLDTSLLSEVAAFTAARIARATRGTVHLIHVRERQLPPFDMLAALSDRVAAIERVQRERHLQRIADEVRRRFGCTCRVELLTGAPARAIATYVRKVGADLIVMTTHGRTGLSRAWFGSVADSLAHEASVPLLMVRQGKDVPVAGQADSGTPFARILVPLDGSKGAEAILPAIRAMGAASSAEQLLVHVVNPVPLPVLDYPDAGIVTAVTVDSDATAGAVRKAEAYLDRIAQRLGRVGSPTVQTTVVVSGSEGAAIVDLAKSHRVDLVAVCSHGRGASRLLLGSVADKVLRGTHCSVLLRRTGSSGKAKPRRTTAAKRPVQR